MMDERAKMTPDEYRHIRRELGLTQAQLAARLGVATNTIARRERGEQPIDREAALALRSLTTHR